MLADEGGARRAGHRVPAALVDEARRMGPLPWSALGPSPAIGEPPGLAGWLAATLDGLWSGFGAPDPFVVVDTGAGDGARAAAVLGLDLACRAALRWLLVDDAPDAESRQRTTMQRAQMARRAGVGDPVGAPDAPALEDPALVLGPAVAGDDPDAAPATPPGIGPLVASLADLPAGLPAAVVLAAGWMRRLPADCMEWHDDRWWEVRLAAGASDDVLDELLVEAGDRAPLDVGLTEGDRRFDVAASRRWLAAARRVADEGMVIAVDLFSPPCLPLGELGAAPRATVEVPPMLAAIWEMGV